MKKLIFILIASLYWLIALCLILNYSMYDTITQVCLLFACSFFVSVGIYIFYLIICKKLKY
jgi:hypothetical protein